jgi:septal ring factor EnvC (AmiA/AmiB activator)
LSFSKRWAASGPARARGTLAILAAALALWLGLPSASPGQDARKTEAELKVITAEIERVATQVSRDQVERDRLARELRTAELSVSDVRATLDRVREERADRAEKRSALAQEKRQRQADLARERESLAGQLRAAYLIGSEEPLKLLLNQKDPARAGRMFAYYSYFGRARADQITRIATNLQRIEQLDGALAAEDEQLAALENERRAQLEKLDAARARRGQVLASLQTESRSRQQSLERLKSQQSGLERLLRELKRAMDKFPADTNTAFARLRGKLAWPVGGRLLARFGESRAGGVKWDGVLVATERGAPVRAVYQGRVVYADWLPGLGLLTIIDHGEGYLSLYGHNDRLYKAVGERVSAGEPVAAAGDSGGRTRPELYFEIRKAGRPVDPRPWFKAAEPGS